MKETIHDEINANTAFRESYGALPDEDMPTFCARITSERDKSKAEIAELRAEVERLRDGLDDSALEYADAVNDAITLRAKLAEFTCPYCDGTGDVHSIDGEWRGECDCKASEPERLRRELKCTEETVGKHGFLGGPTLDACIDAMGSVARESRAKLREIGQMLIEQIGAHGPEDAVDTARRACNALDAANAKLAEIESRHVTPAQDRREPSDDECEQICESADVGFRPHASKATIGRAMFHAVKKWEDGL